MGRGEDVRGPDGRPRRSGSRWRWRRICRWIHLRAVERRDAAGVGKARLGAWGVADHLPWGHHHGHCRAGAGVRTGRIGADSALRQCFSIGCRGRFLLLGVCGSIVLRAPFASTPPGAASLLLIFLPWIVSEVFLGEIDFGLWAPSCDSGFGQLPGHGESSSDGTDSHMVRSGAWNLRFSCHQPR